MYSDMMVYSSVLLVRIGPAAANRVAQTSVTQWTLVHFLPVWTLMSVFKY